MIPSIQLPKLDKRHLREVMATGIKEYGEAPGYKSAAAAHGAGHIILARAIGAHVKQAALLIPDRGDGDAQWEAVVDLAKNFTQGYVTESTDRIALLKAALFFAAGYEGECWADEDHVNSAVPDRYISNYCCNLLDRAIDQPDHTFRHRVPSILEQLFSRYSGEFRAIRDHLEEVGRISEGEVNITLIAVGAINLHELLGRLQ